MLNQEFSKIDFFLMELQIEKILPYPHVNKPLFPYLFEYNTELAPFTLFC